MLHVPICRSKHKMSCQLRAISYHSYCLSFGKKPKGSVTFLFIRFTSQILSLSLLSLHPSQFWSSYLSLVSFYIPAFRTHLLFLLPFSHSALCLHTQLCVLPTLGRIPIFLSAYSGPCFFPLNPSLKLITNRNISCCLVTSNSPSPPVASQD